MYSPLREGVSCVTLQWHHNGHDGISNHQPHHCLLNRLFGRRSKKTSKLRITGLCAGNSPGTGEFPAQMASNADNVSILWCHHENFDFDPYLQFKVICSWLCQKMGQQNHVRSVTFFPLEGSFSYFIQIFVIVIRCVVYSNFDYDPYHDFGKDTAKFEILYANGNHGAAGYIRKMEAVRFV